MQLIFNFFISWFSYRLELQTYWVFFYQMCHYSLMGNQFFLMYMSLDFYIPSSSCRLEFKTFTVHSGSAAFPFIRLSCGWCVTPTPAFHFILFLLQFSYDLHPWWKLSIGTSSAIILIAHTIFFVPIKFFYSTPLLLSFFIFYDWCIWDSCHIWLSLFVP
jgi:hypothetical protein